MNYKLYFRPNKREERKKGRGCHLSFGPPAFFLLGFGFGIVELLKLWIKYVKLGPRSSLRWSKFGVGIW